MIKPCRILAVLLLAALPLTAHCAAKKPIKVKTTKPAPVKFAKFGELNFTQAETQAFIKELAPLIEQSTGKKFKSLPVCRLVTSDESVKISTESSFRYLKQNRKSLPPMTTSEMKDYARASGELYRSVLGLYDVDTDTIYFLPDNFRKRMARADIAVKHHRNIYKLVIVHEMTHYLQYHTAGTAIETTQLKSFDAGCVVDAVVEGYATFIQGKVAGILGIETAQREGERASLLGVVDPGESFMEAQRVSKQQYHKDRYLCGRDFIEWHYKQGGNERVWEILNAPPVRTSMVFHPETYSPEYVPNFDYHELMKGIESKLGPGRWLAYNSQFGELKLREAYAIIGEKKLDEAFSGIEHAQVVGATQNRMGYSITLFVLKDKSRVPVLISAIEQAINKKASAKPNRFYRPGPVVTEDLKGIEADTARKISCVIKKRLL